MDPITQVVVAIGLFLFLVLAGISLVVRQFARIAEATAAMEAMEHVAAAGVTPAPPGPQGI